jgi:hypothetical protein
MGELDDVNFVHVPLSFRHTSPLPKSIQTLPIGSATIETGPLPGIPAAS